VEGGGKKKKAINEYDKLEGDAERQRVRSGEEAARRRVVGAFPEEAVKKGKPVDRRQSGKDLTKFCRNLYEKTRLAPGGQGPLLPTESVFKTVRETGNVLGNWTWRKGKKEKRAQDKPVGKKKKSKRRREGRA